MAKLAARTQLEREVAEAVTNIVGALGITSKDYRDAVEHEYQAVGMGLAPLVHDALLLGTPMTAEHVETMGQCCRRLAAGGVTLGTALSFTPLAMAHVCASGGAPGLRRPGDPELDAAEWVRRTTAYSQQVSLMCVDVWQSAPDTTLVPDPRVPAPTAPLGAPSEADALTPLESTDTQMLLLVAEGRSNQQIASAMSYSSQAVRWHLARLMRRWRVANRAALVTVGFQRGLLQRSSRLATLSGVGVANVAVDG